MEGYLRQILVPQDTMSKFLSLASKNTTNNIETCGILAGRLAYNRLNITHVIVPKQHGTADSCTTMNEEDIFDIQDQQNLITLGWIHVSILMAVESRKFFQFILLYLYRLIPAKRLFYRRLIYTHTVRTKL